MRFLRGFSDASFRLFMTARAIWAPTAMGVAGAVYDDQGRILLVKHRYNPGWRLPGGGVGRGEPPQEAVMRELAEEVGLSGGRCEFFGLYVRKAGWATAVIALYRIRGAQLDFRPNLEIKEICSADPHSPPEGCTPAARKRLRELAGAELSPHW
ncbi:MAG TPA: NUDIX domain-containing protein [Rhizomicrobium sp.]|jgi:8-oxo-dGTP pyrophosphatase MutT (NUDIX family)|nr:NUDIX domain-containing protein [Rhizomicrobium sp.]